MWENGENVLGRWTHTFSPDSDMSLQLYYDRTYFSEPTAPSIFLGTEFEPAGIFSDTLDTYDVNFQHNFSVGDRNKVTWGAGYRFTHDQNDNSPTLAFSPAPLNQNLLSTFVQDEIKLQDDLVLTAGTKVEHNDYTGFEVQPSGRLQWNVTPKQMLWAAVSPRGADAVTHRSRSGGTDGPAECRRTAAERIDGHDGLHLRNADCL